MVSSVKSQVAAVDEWQTCFEVNDSILRNPLQGVDGNTYADWDTFVNSLVQGSDVYPHLPSPNHHNGVLLPFGKLGQNFAFTLPRLSPNGGLRFVRPAAISPSGPNLRALMYVQSQTGDGVCHQSTSLANDGRWYRQNETYRATMEIDFVCPASNHLATPGGYLFWEQYHGAAVGPNWQGIQNPPMALFVLGGRFKLQRYGSTQPRTAPLRFYDYYGNGFVSSPQTVNFPGIDLGPFECGPQQWVVTRNADFTGNNSHFRVERNGVLLHEDFETNAVDWSANSDATASQVSTFGQYFLSGNPDAVVDFRSFKEERRVIAA